MISASICNPAVNEPFRSFTHNTTTYVGVPHDAVSRLWITTPESGYLTIEAEDQTVVADLPIAAPGGSVEISQLKQPIKVPSGFIPPFLRFGRKPKKVQLRLYAFRAVFSREPLTKDGTPNATFDFHLLCEEDYNWARTFELRLMMNPAEIAPATIGDVAEGTCTKCAEVRERLRNDWLPG